MTQKNMPWNFHKTVFQFSTKRKEESYSNPDFHAHSFTSLIFFLSPCREGMPGYVRSEHAAVWWPVTAGDCGHVCWPVLLPQRLQRRVTDPAGWFPNVPGLRLPLWPHAQVPFEPGRTYHTISDHLSWMFRQAFYFVCVHVSRLEQAKEDESKDALKDLVNLVTCLTTYGVTELKPAGLTTGAPFLLPGFVLPQPSGKGVLSTSSVSKWRWLLWIGSDKVEGIRLRRRYDFRNKCSEICFLFYVFTLYEVSVC